MGFGVGVDEEEAAGCETDDIRIFCKSVWTSPGVKNFVGDRSGRDGHRVTVIL